MRPGTRVLLPYFLLNNSSTWSTRTAHEGAQAFALCVDTHVNKPQGCALPVDTHVQTVQPERVYHAFVEPTLFFLGTGLG